MIWSLQEGLHKRPVRGNGTPVPPHLDVPQSVRVGEYSKALSWTVVPSLGSSPHVEEQALARLSTNSPLLY